MPRHARPRVELEKVASYFKFLATVPYADADDPAVLHDCPVCKEPFKLTQTPEETMNQPVRLSCGHIFGIQCLARWMLSENFDGCCSYCRTTMVRPSQLGVPHPAVTALLTSFEILCHFDGALSAKSKTALMGAFDKSRKLHWHDKPQDAPRLKMVWEELLNNIFNQYSLPEPAQVPAQVPAQPAPDLQAGIQEVLMPLLQFLAAILQPLEARLQFLAPPLRYITRELHFLAAPLRILLAPLQALVLLRRLPAAAQHFFAQLERQQRTTNRDKLMASSFYFGGMLMAFQLMLLWDRYHSGTREVFLDTSASLGLGFSLTLFVMLTEYEISLSTLKWIPFVLWLSFFTGYTVASFRSWRDADGL